MSSPMETPAPESPGIFAEGDLKVLIVYFLAFGIWTAAAGNDFISSTWKSVRETRQKGKLHVALVFFPTIVIAVYVVFQHKTLDYKEMGAALLAFSFAVLHLSRTFMGLWQLHEFQQWAISSMKSMESLGYKVDENREESDSDEADEGLRQWTIQALKWAWKKVIPHGEPDRIERIADSIVVNETLVDNRLSDVHTVCNFRLLSRKQSETVKKKERVLKRLCLRYWFRVWNAPRVFQVLFSLIFFETPQVPNSSSGPRLDPRHPESLWLKWATALVAHAGWKLQGTTYMDPNSTAGYTEHRNQFAEQLLLSASLHTHRMAEAGPNTPGNVEEGSIMSGFLSFPDWHKYPELCKGKFSKQEWLKHACTTGSGLPYGMNHPKAKKTEDRWGYGNFKSELRRAREALPPELETRVEGFDVEMLEWFTIFVSVKDWASGSSPRAHSVDAERNPESNQQEPENDIPVENLKKQLGYTKEDSFVVGRSHFPLLQTVSRAILWDNRNVLEISCHIDNWIALCAGEQASYMVERIPWMKRKLSLENSFRKSSTISSGDDGYRSIEQVVGECASFEKYRFLCQMAIIQPEHYHLDQSLTFLGCSMEMLRSSLAVWVESHQSTEQASWKPALFSNESAPESRKRIGLSSFQSSDDFISCIQSLEKVKDMSKAFVKMRVLWELQSHFQTRLREKGATPGSLEAIALCILSFPALAIEVRDIVLTVVEGKNESRVDVGEDDADQFRIENHEYVIQSSGGPQDLRLILSFKAVTEKSELLCEIEGMDVDYFDWEAWRNAFYGRLEACRLWKEKTGVSNFSLIVPSHPLNAGVQKVPCSTAPSIPESGAGTEIFIWKGWLPHCASICKYEIASKGFILESRENEGVPITVSTGEDMTYNFTVPQEVWEHVDYVEASAASLKNASIVAHELLSTDLWCQLQENAPSAQERTEVLLSQDCSAISSSELRFLEVAAIQKRNTNALEKVIHALLQDGKNREAIARGVTLLERFYVFGSDGTSNLYSFCNDEKYVETVISLFELIFESSDCDKFVAERFQLFFLLLMRYRPKEVSDNALSVILRSMVRKCHSAEAGQSAESVAALCLALHSGSKLEEFAVVVSAHANVANCPLTSRNRSASLRDEVNIQLCLAIQAVAGRAGGRDALEELGLSPNRTMELLEQSIEEAGSSNTIQVLANILAEGGGGIDRNIPRAVELLNRSITEDDNFDAMNSLAMILEKGDDGIEKDVGRAVELYTRAVDEGKHTDAMYNFALLLLEGGEGVDRDVPRAVELLNRSITEGSNFYAMNRLAMILENGDDGVEKDVGRTVELYTRAVDEGKHTDAMYNFAVLLLEGEEGVDRDVPRAVELLNRCIAECGDFDAMNRLAMILENGEDGVGKNISRCMTLYSRAVNEGKHKKAMYNLGVLLCGDKAGVESDIAHAAYLFNRCIDENGNVDAMVKYAELLQTGWDGASADIPRALNLYERAVNEGQSVDAMHKLAVLLESEIEGIEKNIPRAVSLYSRAVDEGKKPESMMSLGRLLEAGGDGVAKNPGRAVELYTTAVDEHGSTEAMERLASALHSGGDGIEKDAVRAVALYTRAIAEGGSTAAMGALARILEVGDDGVPADPERAAALYERNAREN